MSARRLLESFERWRAAGRPLVLATVFETAGSTYSKAGAQMLINGEGDFQGMLSGGCLEGDLSERARQVLQSGQPQSVTYDLGVDDAGLWGLGVGCDGLMRIFLQPLFADRDYQPFAAMCAVLRGDTPGLAATVIESAAHGAAPGASLVCRDGGVAWCDIEGPALDAIRSQLDVRAACGDSATRDVRVADALVRVLLAVLRPPPRILILGAGLDAEPVVRLITELGWRVVVQDHRPAYIEAGDFATAERILCVPADQLPAAVDFAAVDGAVVMSHHLATDRRYLELLAPSRIRYIGLLGPPPRRERLLDELGENATALRGRLRGPAGIDIAARGPAAIALSIVAELHQALMSGPGPAGP